MSNSAQAEIDNTDPTPPAPTAKPKRKIDRRKYKYYVPVTKDKRFRNNGQKLDIKKVIQLRDVNKLSFSDIGKATGFDQGYICRAYTTFKKLLPEPGIVDAYTTNRTNILNGIELNLLQNLGNSDKLQKASLNNVAYAVQNISNLRRLEEGKSIGGASVNIEITFQEAMSSAKQSRLKHAGSGVAEVLESSDTKLITED